MDRDQGDRLIGDHLEAVRAALWRSAFFKNLLVLFGGLLTAVLSFAIIDQWFYSFGMVARSVWIIGIAVATVWWMATRVVPLVRLRVSPEYAAYSVELDEPDFQHALTSYVTLRNDRDAPGLRGIVVRSIGARAAKHLTSSGMSMPTETLGNFRPGMFAAIMFAALILYAVFSPKNTAQSISRLAAPLADIAPPARVAISDVQPGDTESLHGRKLDILATIEGLKSSDNPRIVISGPIENEISLARNEVTNTFIGSIPANLVQDSFQYQIVAGDASSRWFDVTVRDEPTVSIAEVQYSPHPYTKLSPRTSSVGAISGLEGTRVTLIANTSRKVVRGRIEFNPREVDGRTSATAGFASLDISDDGRTISTGWNLRTGRRGGGQLNIDSYRMRVWDETDTPNSDPIVYPIQVTPDLAPEVRITVPATWPKDVPLGTEQLIEVRAVDPDFGLAKVQLRMRRGTRLIETIDLLNAESGGDAERGNKVLSHAFSPDRMGLMVGDLVTIEAVAMDNRTNVEGTQPDPNVVVSDPIELKIVERVAPDDLVNDGDGLKKQADETAQEPNSQEQQEKEQDQENEQNEGEQQSGSDQKGDKQQGGGGASESEASEKGEGQGSGGESSDQPQDGENSSGENGSGEGRADESQSGAQQGENGTEESEGGEESNAGQPESTDASGETGADGSPQDGNNNQGRQSADSNGAEPNGEASTDSAEDRQSGPDQQSSSRQGTRSGQGDQKQPPASSDGEAIERIRDYLNEKQQAQEDSGKAESQPESGSDSEGAGADGRQGEKANSASKPDPESSQSGTGSKAGDETNQESDEPAAKGSGSTPDPDQKSESASESGSKPSDQDSSNENLGNKGAGEKPPQQPTGEQSTGEQSDGEQANAEQSTGEQSAGESNTGTQSAEDGSSGESDSSDTSSASGSADGKDSGSEGNPENAKSGKGNEGQAQDQAGETAESSSADPSQQDSAQSQRDAANDRTQQSDTSKPSESASENQSGNQAGESASSETGSQSNATPPQDPTDAKPSESADGNAVGNNTSGESMPSGTQPGNANAPQAPDPVDVEAAKEATDLVLDSLKNQKENPEQELLDRLGWTPDQLRKFVDRWEKTRSLGQKNDPAAQRQYEESLKSLGIRPPGRSGPRKSEGRNDQLRDVQDTGQRTVAPPQFRDAIEAYRRSLRSEQADN